jgi:hypothetical protein
MAIILCSQNTTSTNMDIKARKSIRNIPLMYSYAIYLRFYTNTPFLYTPTLNRNKMSKSVNKAR